MSDIQKGGIRAAVQKRITDAWGWLPDEPEAQILAENVEFVARLLVLGTRTEPETLISALIHGPNWGPSTETQSIAAIRRMPDRPEVVPLEEPFRRHAYIRGYRDAMEAVRIRLPLTKESA